jgi:mannose/fructose/N-acetylgalactosamine-specific phosphotransferase system component IIC
MEILIFGIFLAAILSLDITHAFQTLISQPIFASVVLGLIWGHPEVGLIMGIVFELIFLRILPVGGNAFPENNMAAMTATIIMIALIRENPQLFNQYLILVIPFGFLHSYIGMKVTVYHRKWNNHFLNKIKQISQDRIVNSAFFIKIIIASMVHFVASMFLSGLILAIIFYQLVLKLNGYWISLLPDIPPIFWIIVFSVLGIITISPIYLKRENG